jgi:hypothetical protein
MRMLRIRRKRDRQTAELARLLATLDALAGDRRPTIHRPPARPAAGRG